MVLVVGVRLFLDLIDVLLLVVVFLVVMEMKVVLIEESWIIFGKLEVCMVEYFFSVDRVVMIVLWDCMVGSFCWYFVWDEIVMILEGEVCVMDVNGVVCILKVGDIVYFVGDIWVIWQIDNYVCKIVFLCWFLLLLVVLVLKVKIKFVGLIKCLLCLVF